MKTELLNNDGFRIFAYLEPANDPDGYQMLKITTQWDNARNPEDEQVKLNLILSPDALNNLRTLIN